MPVPDPAERTRLAFLLGSKHLVGPDIQDALGALSESDRATLASIAEGRRREVTKGDRVKAIALLAKIGDDAAATTLGRILADRHQDPALRASAATGLGTMPPDLAEPRLVPFLNITETEVARRVLRAVGQVGREEARTALAGAADRLTEVLGREYALARVLVTYRVGANDVRLNIPPAAKRSPDQFTATLDVTLEPASQAEIGEVLRYLEGADYGLRFSTDTGFLVHIGAATWWVALDTEVVRSGLDQALAHRGRVPALLARRLAETGTFSMQYLVVSQPRGEEVELAVLRTDGETMYSGRAQPVENGLRFSIADVQRAGTAPTLVEGTVAGTDTHVVSYADPRRRRKRQTHALTIEGGAPSA